MSAPAREDFDRWREDFVTRWVFRGLQAAADEQQAQWLRSSWQNGVTNPAQQPQLFAELQELRTRADAFRAMIEGDYDMWCDWNQQEPEQ